MKKLAISLCIVVFAVTNTCVAKRVLEDKIIARVTLLSVANILMSDLNLPHVDADKYSLEEVITKELYFQEATRRKLSATVTDVEKQISSYKEANNIKTEEELEESLKKLGFTLKRYKLEITRYIAISSLLQTEIKSRIFVTAQDVDKYYKAHPIWEEEKYILKTCIIPFNQVKDEKDIVKMKDADFDWIKTDDWVGKSFLSDRMSFVPELKVGEISKPIKTEYGYQLVMIDEKRETRKASLDDCYVAIEKKLKDEKMEKFEDEYKKELWKKATIVYLD